MKVICVSGVPGTGKTTLSRKLAAKLDYFYLDVNRFISEHKISSGYDKKRKTEIIDIVKLNKALIKEIKNNKKMKGIIIDSHLSHYLPRKYVNFCVITKCAIKELNKRLKKKCFGKNKIKENLQAEIFDVCYNEAIGKKHKIIVADTTKDFNMFDLSKKLSG
ncbi:hypothetical protein CMO83_03675 [Candidatus Woesearchaeota archaeon]|jgi:adenylate kinase|nr:hypothetical protein [Candidatus Woesearchaeota archaeon]|tara:strand:+ start:17956 stop:18441 length:486 start_codon:yes stop_codon:yes gene_type:complete